MFVGAPHSRKRKESAKCRMIEPPRFVSADTAILEQLYGEGWVSIGDAAMSYDPIAAHGMTMAMVSARDASTLIIRHLNGEKDALRMYSDAMRSAFRHYCQERKKIYAQERRYIESQYWLQYKMGA